MLNKLDSQDRKDIKANLTERLAEKQAEMFRVDKDEETFEGGELDWTDNPMSSTHSKSRGVSMQTKRRSKSITHTSSEMKAMITSASNYTRTAATSSSASHHSNVSEQDVRRIINEELKKEIMSLKDYISHEMTKMVSVGRASVRASSADK